MALSEFELIRRYFQQPGLMADPVLHPEVALGIGDDCALLDFGAATRLAISLDVLVAGVHFPAAADPQLIGERALAVALSDLAAMGATPLGLWRNRPGWLAFRQGWQQQRSATAAHCSAATPRPAPCKLPCRCMARCLWARPCDETVPVPGMRCG
jgi:thiamine-monophosphate kinase